MIRLRTQRWFVGLLLVGAGVAGVGTFVDRGHAAAPTVEVLASDDARTTVRVRGGESVRGEWVSASL